MQEGLKPLPCPFCGGEAYRSVTYPYPNCVAYLVGCNACKFFLETDGSFGKYEVVVKWNTRPADSPKAAKVEDEKFPPCEFCGCQIFKGISSRFYCNNPKCSDPAWVAMPIDEVAPRPLPSKEKLEQDLASLRTELAALQPKVEHKYEGDTAKGWYEAWNRENDAWQKMVQHHEELEDAVKAMLKDGMKPTEYLEAMEKVRQILAVEGSAPTALQPKPEAKEGALAIARAQGMHVGLCQQGMTRWDAMRRVRETFEKWYPTEHLIIKELPDDRFF